MKLLKTIALLFCFALTNQIFAEQATFDLTCRHLRLYQDVSSGDQTGRIGMYLRSETIQYSDELLCYADLSSLTGVTVTNVRFKFYVSSVFNGTATNPATAVLYEQNKASYNSGAEYLTYSKTTWDNPVGSLGLTSSEPTGYKEISTSDLITLIQAYTSGTKLNRGFILGANCEYYNYYFNISLVTYKVKLIVDYTPAIPINAAPDATISPISGIPEVGSVLTGNYTYSDAESNPEGASIFSWYRADNSSGTYTKIVGAGTITYTLQNVDDLKYIKFEVTPVATTGTSPGLPKLSGYVGPVVTVLYKYPNVCGAGDNMKVDGNVKIGGKIVLPPLNAGGDVIQIYNSYNDHKAREELVIDAPGGINILAQSTFGINIPNGDVIAKRFKIGDWFIKTPDYVFRHDYPLRPLKDVENFVKKNNHLPEVPSAEEMKKNGVDLAEMNMILLKKVEELTLYSIEQNKKFESQNEKIANQQKEIENIKKELHK